MSDIKILHRVHMNGGFAYVLDKKPVLKYYRVGNFLYGTDGLFYSCYFYEAPTKYSKAFAGRKFNITLETGEIINCNGQWWYGGHKGISEIAHTDLSSVTVATPEELEKCYVFHGLDADILKWKKLLTSFNGNTYDYYDYDKILSHKNLIHKICDLEKDKAHLIKNIKQKSQQIKEIINICTKSN